jgi:nicotinamidase-related amidase
MRYPLLPRIPRPRPKWSSEVNLRFATSSYRAGRPGNDLKPEATPVLGETIIAKHTNSAFIGSELDRLLRRASP